MRRCADLSIVSSARLTAGEIGRRMISPTTPDRGTNGRTTMTTTNKTAEQMIEEVKAEIARVACFDWMTPMVNATERMVDFRKSCEWRDTVREHARAGRMAEAQAMADRFVAWFNG